MKAVLAITYCFPPIFVPASMCYLKLMKGLHELGYSICVLSIDPRSFQSPWKIDERLKALVPKEIENKTVWSLETNLFIRFCKKYGLLKRLYEPFKMEWYYPAIRKARRIRDFDIILTCSQPHACHWVGYYLKRRTKKPWIAYFSDPWTDNPYVEYPSRRIFARHLEMEKTVIENADRVMFTTAEMRNLVMKKYPESLAEKAGVLPHCFVPDWYSSNGKKEATRRGKIRIVHTGHFYKIRTPMPLLRAIKGLKKDIKELENRMELLSFGDVEKDHIDYAKQNDLCDIIRFNGTIPYIESLKMMKGADYLLLVDAPLTRNNESVFLPSKLIDYVGSYKPVLGITPSQGASAKALSQTGNLSCDVEDIKGICDSLRAIIENELHFSPDKEQIDRYHYGVVSKRMSKVIEDL